MIQLGVINNIDRVIAEHEAAMAYHHAVNPAHRSLIA
jgi:hypothetical protein